MSFNKYCINIVLISLIVLVLNACYKTEVFAGECLGSSEEDKYQALLLGYQQIKDGKRIDYLPVFSNRCWSPNDDLDKKTRSLLEEIISDKSLKESDLNDAVSSYLDLYGPNVFLEPYIENSTGMAKEELINKLIYLKLPETFDSISYFKRQISKETNPKLKQRMVERLANDYNGRFNEFVIYSKKNDIVITPHVLVRFRDMSALKHLFEQTNFLSEDFTAPYDYAHSYSEYIHKVLAKNLDIVFLLKYVEYLDSKQLRHLRNGILATYGKKFKSKILQDYFGRGYLQSFCRKGICGLSKPKGSYKDSDLTQIDKTNITTILAIESNKRNASDNSQQIFVENYNFEEFMNGGKDNFVFSSSKIQKLKHIKIDWQRHEIIIWDRFGISVWNYLTGKRIKLIKKAKGPIGLASDKRLFAYQLNGDLVIEHIDSSEIVLQTKITRTTSDNWINTLSYFTRDGLYFIFQTEQGTLSIFNTLTKTRNDINLGSGRGGYAEEFSCTDYNAAMINKPFVVTNDNELIGKLNAKWITLTLDDVSTVRLLDSGFFAFDNHRYCSLALSPDGNYLYGDPGSKDPIQRFRIDQISKAESIFPDSDLSINHGPPNLRSVEFLEGVDNLLFYGGSGHVGWFDLNYREINETKSFKGIYGTTVDVSIKDRMMAVGNALGFVVFKKLPKEEIAK